MSQALQPDQKRTAYLDEIELQIIEGLSRADPGTTEDPMEKLSSMSDEAVEKFFEHLKSRSIIRS